MSSRDFIDDFNKKTDFKGKQEEAAKILSSLNDRWLKSYQIMNPFYAEAYMDLGFYLGNQWSAQEIAYLNEQRRSSYTFNKIRKVVNAIDGYQRKNRLETVFKPTESQDNNATQQYTQVIRQIMLQNQGYEKISDAFKGSLTTGLSILSPWICYDDDMVSGDIKFHIDPWNSIALDPFFTNIDLSDCSFAIKRKYLPRNVVKSLVPHKADLIETMPIGKRDEKFPYMPYVRNPGLMELMSYTEYWNQTYEQRKVWINRETGEYGDWKGNDIRLEMFRRMNPAIDVVTKSVKTVKLGIVVENELMSYGPDPFGLDDYPFVPFIGVFEPSYDLFQWKIQSLVRIMRDPQKEVNKRRSKTVDFVDAQANSGFMAKKTAVTNPEALYQTGQGKVIWKSESSQPGDIERLEPPQIPPSWFQLEELYSKDIMEDAGLNSEVFGMADQQTVETAAILAKVRQDAALVNLQGLFDGLRKSQTLLGKKTLKMVQKNYTPEKITRMINQEPDEAFYNPQFGKYDCVVSEGILTDNQKEANFLKYLMLKQMGVPVSDAKIVASSNLQDSEELSQEIAAQQESMAQAAQMEQQAKIQDLQARAKLAEARSFADEGLGAERYARIPENRALAVERMAEADKERDLGELHKVQAMKELATMDVSHIESLVNILKTVSELGDAHKIEKQNEKVSASKKTPSAR